MIDEQHPMQIGMFPMDIKCHTPQQLQQQLQQQQQQIQQQQQQQQQQQPQPHFNSHNTTGGDGIRVRASTGAAAVVVTSPTSANVIGNHRSSNHNNNGNTTANSANNNSSSSNSTNNKSNNTNSNNSSNSGSNANSQSANNNSNNNKTISSLNSNQQSNAGGGPGPPGSAAGATITTGQTSPTSATMTGTTAGTGGVAVGGATNATNASTSGSGRVTLAECVVNGGPLGVVVGGRGNNNNNNHNNNTNHNNSSNNANNNNFNGNISHCGLDGNCEQQQQQQQLQHQQQNHQHPITIQQQQQHTMLQHHLQQLQLHPPQPPVILSQQQQQQQQFHHHHNNNNQHNNNNNHHHNNNHQHQRLHHHHHHQHHHHPAAILHQHSNGSASVSAGMGDVINVVVAATVTANGTLSSNGSTNNNHSPCSTSNAPMAQCGHCCQPICDRYIMRVVDTSYHEGCLKCSTCALHLVHSCFARDGKLYCRIDYERLFIRNRCLGCGHKIGSEELVMRTLENVFHLKCFACVVCGALLKKGEQYVVKQGQLFCRFDYEKEVEMLQGYEDFYGDDLFPPKLDGRRGPKRPRTILNTQQRRAFKASFEVSPKPCRKVRENLAKETGLSLRIVQVWFQNQRAKVKKIQKKAKQEHAKGASETDSQESDSSLAKIKDEAHSDTESLLESPFSACGIGGSGLGVGVAAPDGVSKLRLVKDENENAAFNCMETNKENCNKTNEPILNTILGLSYATFQQLMGPFTQSPMVNPIDRLYSMQNSYFRPEDMGFGECGGPKEMVDN